MPTTRKIALLGLSALAVLLFIGDLSGSPLADWAIGATASARAEVAREAQLLSGGPVGSATAVDGAGPDSAVAAPRAVVTPTATGVPEPFRPAADGRAAAKAPPAASEQEREYSFTYPGAHPGGWNPCAPIPVLVNLKNAPTGALDDVRQAFAQVNAASRLMFTVIGTTTLPPSADWGMDSSGSWKPVLVAWEAPGSHLITGSEAGATSTVAINTPGGMQIVSGVVELNSAMNGYYRPGFGSGMYRGTLLLHEFGHLAGLDHVSDPDQVMYPVTQGAAGLGPGDLAGLRLLGRRKCSVPPPPHR